MVIIINVQFVGWTFPKIVIIATEGADTEICKIKVTYFKIAFILEPIIFDCGTEFIHS